MFRTEIHLTPSENKISLNSKILCLGSCFADEIGNKLINNKFKAKVNPWGIVFNPTSLCNNINRSLNNEMPPDDSYLENEGIFRNYNFHSTVSGLNEKSYKKRIKTVQNEVSEFIQQIDWLFLTFGTSIVYRRKNNNEIVANCHKIPSEQFQREFLEVNEVVANVKATCSEIIALNSNLNIVLTVSPVRHLKETFEDNTISKSILHLACRELTRIENVEYFPAYELVMDDLRDYRFYKEDLLHPNSVCIDYVWNKFTQKYFDLDALEFLSKWEKLSKSIQHRAQNPGSKAHHEFVKKTISEIEQFPYPIDLNAELISLRKSLDEKS